MQKTIFIIEDEFHSDTQGKFSSYEEAMGELKKWAKIPWNEGQNEPACISGNTCRKEYVLIEYLITDGVYKEIKRTKVFDISAKGVKWYL